MAISLATLVKEALTLLPAQRLFDWQTHASLALVFVAARRRKSMQQADRSGASAAVRSHG